jgi:hypothetical protein
MSTLAEIVARATETRELAAPGSPLQHQVDDTLVLAAALEAVLALADLWDGRAAHTFAFAETAPEDVRDDLTDGAWNFRYRAQNVRAAVNDVLTASL